MQSTLLKKGILITNPFFMIMSLLNNLKKI